MKDRRPNSLKLKLRTNCATLKTSRLDIDFIVDCSLLSFLIYFSQRLQPENINVEIDTMSLSNVKDFQA